MAEIDTSIYNTPERDRFGRVKSLFDVLGKANEVQKGQLDIAGQVGLGKALQEATNPDGSIDTEKLTKLLAKPENYPAAVPGAPLALDLKGKQLGNKGIDIANQKANIDLAQTGYNNIATAWGARLSSGKPFTRDDLMNDALDVFTAGRAPKSVVLDTIRTLPTDAKALRDWATKGYLQSLGSPALAAPAPAAPGPGGEPKQQTTGEFLSQSLGAGDAAAAPRVTGGGLVTGMSPAAVASESKRGGAAADQATELIGLANRVPDRKAQLYNLRDYASQFTGGPMSDTIYGAISGLNEVLGTKIARGEVASKEEFDKIATQIALQQSGAIGATDLTTRTAMGANPHSGLSKLGTEGILATLIGNEDAIAAKGNAFNASGKKYEDYPAWSLEFNKNFDPRIFQVQYLSPENKKVLLDGMNARERALFRERFNYAVEQGWVPDPRKG